MTLTTEDDFDLVALDELEKDEKTTVMDENVPVAVLVTGNLECQVRDALISQCLTRSDFS